MSTEIVFNSAPVEQDEEGRFNGHCDTFLWDWVYQQVFDEQALFYADVRIHREDLLNLQKRLAGVTEDKCQKPYEWEEMKELKDWTDRILRDFNFKEKRMTVKIIS